LAFCFAKITAAFAYLYRSKDLDYAGLFEIYCSEQYGGGGFDLLNSIHYFLFRTGCSLGEITYFWLFVTIQLILLLISFDKLYKYKFKGHKIILVALYFSPTILFFSSAPTKDGFFVSLTCIGIILANKFYNIFLFVSGAIKPYLLALYTLRTNGTFIRLVLIILGFVALSYFGEQLLNLIIVRWSYFSIDFGGFSLGSFVWTMEILVIAALIFYSQVFFKRDIFFVLMICALGAGVNINVASRIFVISIFYLLALRLLANARA